MLWGIQHEEEELVQDRSNRYAPLTGIAFVVITIVAFATGGGETPNANASPAKVILYYAKHRSEIETSSVLIVFGFLFAVLWAGALRSYLRRTPGAEGLASLVLAGGVLMAVGAVTLAGIEYGLAHQLYHLGPQVAQTLNFLANELFLPLLVGGFLFGVCAGLAILRGAALPRWLGWVAIVIGVAAVIPPVSFFALLGFLLWSLVTSIIAFKRLSGAAPAAPADTAPPRAEPASG
jgi:hypothetical protein